MLITRSLATIAFITLIALMVVPGYSAIGMEVQKSSDNYAFPFLHLDQQKKSRNHLPTPLPNLL